MIPTPAAELTGLTTMMFIRAFERALSARRDHGFQLLSTGEEAVAVSLCSALRPGDQLLTGGRCIGAALARGVAPGEVMAELLGRSDGPNRGKAGRGHLSDPDSGFFGAHAVVGGNISIAAGVALANQLAGGDGIVAVLFGDGACGAGGLHETLNLAAIWRLPLLVVCSNNQLSVSTRRADVLAPPALAELARPFGIPGVTVDGMDLDEASAALMGAAARIRAGEGPQFVECISERFASHSTTARETRGADELASVRSKCPIARSARRLIADGALTDARFAELAREVDEAVAGAVKFAEASPLPSADEALIDVW